MLCRTLNFLSCIFCLKKRKFVLTPLFLKQKAVEDERIVARDLQVILEELNYQEKHDRRFGELAIQKAAENQPNLILMNIRIIGETDSITTAQMILEEKINL